jgi:hypothetical protein
MLEAETEHTRDPDGRRVGFSSYLLPARARLTRDALASSVMRAWGQPT